MADEKTPVFDSGNPRIEGALILPPDLKRPKAQIIGVEPSPKKLEGPLLPPPGEIPPLPGVDRVPANVKDALDSLTKERYGRAAIDHVSRSMAFSNKDNPATPANENRYSVQEFDENGVQKGTRTQLYFRNTAAVLADAQLQKDRFGSDTTGQKETETYIRNREKMYDALRKQNPGKDDAALVEIIEQSADNWRYSKEAADAYLDVRYMEVSRDGFKQLPAELRPTAEEARAFDMAIAKRKAELAQEFPLVQLEGIEPLNRDGSPAGPAKPKEAAPKKEDGAKPNFNNGDKIAEEPGKKVSAVDLPDEVKHAADNRHAMPLDRTSTEALKNALPKEVLASLGKGGKSVA